MRDIWNFGKIAYARAFEVTHRNLVFYYGDLTFKLGKCGPDHNAVFEMSTVAYYKYGVFIFKK